MAEETLTKDSILDAAESVLRKFGLAKTNMSDIGRVLGVSHAALYRHFDGKAALRKAVVERWLRGSFAPLDAVVEEEDEPDKRLYRWLQTLRAFKRERARKDPELFAMYAALVAETEGALEEHFQHLMLQLTSIIEAGMAAGTFACEDAAQSAMAVLVATTRFHHAAHAAEWELPDSDARFEAIWNLLLNGLASRA